MLPRVMFRSATRPSIWWNSARCVASSVSLRNTRSMEKYLAGRNSACKYAEHTVDGEVLGRSELSLQVRGTHGRCRSTWPAGTQPASTRNTRSMEKYLAGRNSACKYAEHMVDGEVLGRSELSLQVRGTHGRCRSTWPAGT